jgi:hypothetical protein
MQQLQMSLGGPSRLRIMLVSNPKYWDQDRVFVHQLGVPFALAYYTPDWDPDTVARIFQGRASGRRVSYGLPVSYVFGPSSAPALLLIGTEDWVNPQHRSFWLGLTSG